MQSKPKMALSLKHFFLPKSNHWLKRIILVFTFTLLDYLFTLVFCHVSYQEANVYARIFMESFGIQLGLTMFVLVANLPIYMILSVDSHVIRIPPRTAMFIEPFVDAVFAWFVAGLHFSGGSSWFWHAPDVVRQTVGALLYLIMAFLFVKPHKPRYDS